MAAAEGLDTSAGGSGDGSTLRLVWPQWQGAGTSSVRSLAAEFPFDAARRGYAVGSAVLKAVLPHHDGPITAVPVETGDVGLEKLAVTETTGRRISPCPHVAGRRAACFWRPCSGEGIETFRR
jgi:hypothetical protein